MAENVAPLNRASAMRAGADRSGWLERNAHLVMPMPAVIGVLAMLAFPLVYTLWMSLHEWTLGAQAGPIFVGLDNYTKLLTADTRFFNAIWVTFYFTAVAVSVQTLLGVTLALLFNRQFWGRGILRTLAILPMVATPVAIALIFVMMYHPTLGVLNYLLRVIGLSPWTWTYAAGSAIPALAIVDTWQWTPLIMLICLAGLAALPGEPYEAAMIDGASKWQMLWLITLPLLRPTIVTAVLFRLIDSLKTFDVIFVMTQGGPGNASDTINLYLYNTAFAYLRMGQASAMVVVFFAIILALSIVAIRIRRAAWD
jgi:multiple sugar transport system permease protein